MNTKEHILHFLLQGQISLGQHDYKFISNLENMIHADKRITSNQAELFDKLIRKYTKQLNKINVTAETLLELPWNATIIESTPEFTGATISIVDDEIVIRVPFNKKFISDFNALENNPFVWQRKDREYRSSFNTHSLKIAVKYLASYFATMNFCENITNILNDLKQYQTATIWDPTLVKLDDNNYVIAACNEQLGNIINTIPLNLSSKALLNMSRYGIKVARSLIENDPKLTFAYSFVNEIDIDDLEMLVSWLIELECKVVLFNRGVGLNKNVHTEIENALLKANISFLPEHAASPALCSTSTFLFSTHPHRPIPSFSKATTYIHSVVEKIVVLRNSRPIDIK